MRFSHYRDKNQVEVDFVIERGQKLWGVEVKRAVSVQGKDAAGLARLADQAGKQLCSNSRVKSLPGRAQGISMRLMPCSGHWVRVLYSETHYED
ncbi:DUF4143 domain-containing protein [Halomonas sp. TRM85114]|nr:DUF4143 domain-containing protein [Halomonas jincaotanensis]